MRKRDTVKEALELPVPGESRWVSRYRAGYAVVVVEQLPPQELISGDGLPLSAGQTSSQHGSTALHPNILKRTNTLCYLSFFFLADRSGTWCGLLLL
uniref:Uncharacterized protein n=1 Tax=Oryzias latipes TaxID=8090 RepID=A0A3P9LD46_ORYLA